MKQIKCPLCGLRDSRVSICEDIDPDSIVAITKELYNIDIRYLFSQNIKYCKCLHCGLGFFNPLTAGDEEYYNKLSSNEWYYLHSDKSEYEFAKKYLKDGIRVLDIGSGRGVFGLIASNTEYTGLELGGIAVEQARKDGLNVIQETIEDFAAGHKGDKFDLLVTFQVLEHITDINGFITSAMSVMKDDGLFIIAVPNNDSLLRYASNNILNILPHHLLHWNQTSMQFLAEKYGFNIIETFREPVTSIHKRWFNAIKISRMFKNVFFIKHRLIDVSLNSKIVSKIANWASRFLVLIGWNIVKGEFGHTIVFVLKKRAYESRNSVL